jgi:AAT family amino acid transporter
MTNLVLHRRFVDDALGFALTWNYWFNDAVSTASDIIAVQLLLEFWTDNFPGWAISLIFLVVVIALNVLSVRVYGEVRSVFLLTVCTSVTNLLILGRILAEFTQSHHYCGMSKHSTVSPSCLANPVYRSSLSSVLLSTAAATLNTNISAASTGISEMPRSLAVSVDSPLSLSQPHLPSTSL